MRIENERQARFLHQLCPKVKSTVGRRIKPAMPWIDLPDELQDINLADEVSRMGLMKFVFIDALAYADEENGFLEMEAIDEYELFQLFVAERQSPGTFRQIHQPRNQSGHEYLIGVHITMDGARALEEWDWSPAALPAPALDHLDILRELAVNSSASIKRSELMTRLNLSPEQHNEDWMKEALKELRFQGLIGRGPKKGYYTLTELGKRVIDEQT